MKYAALEQLGLDQREITIYRTLISLGPSPIRTIAEKSGINRGTTYDCLKGLLQKGVVSYLPKGKRRLFSPEPLKYYCSWLNKSSLNCSKQYSC